MEGAVPYKSAAAGHQGISTSADGAMLIKPCTQAEINFYESAKDHPAFQAHLPVYMGHLSQASPELQQQASQLQNTQNGADDAPKPPNRTSTISMQPLTRTPTVGHRRADSGHIVSDPRIGRSATKEWTPSGGAKLSSHLSIVLSNATSGFVRPNVIDLKLGARLWDDDAPTAKRKKLDDVAASSTSGSLGFRVAGMKVHVGDDAADGIKRETNTEVADGYKTFNKFYGRDSITKENIADAFEAFLYSLGLPAASEDDSAETKTKKQLRTKLLLKRLHREISSIEYALANEESRMYSASILMVYEGDPNALESVLIYKQNEKGETTDVEAIEPEDQQAAEYDEDDPIDEEDEMPKQKIHEVVMIDFAHAHWTPGQGPDENALQGVRSIKVILEGLLGEMK